MQLQVQKYLQVARAQLLHHRAALGKVKLQAHLDPPHGTVEPVDHPQRRFARREIESDNQLIERVHASSVAILKR